jgi:hypothetical protein
VPLSVRTARFSKESSWFGQLRNKSPNLEQGFFEILKKFGTERVHFVKLQAGGSKRNKTRKLQVS